LSCASVSQEKAKFCLEEMVTSAFTNGAAARIPSVSIQIADEPQVALDDRNCRRCNGAKCRAPAACRVIAVQRQRLAMNLQLFLPIGRVKIRCGFEPVEECLLLRRAKSRIREDDERCSASWDERMTKRSIEPANAT
jgi:hypothetical protein